MLKGQVARPTRHRVVADIDEPAGFEPSIEEPAQRALVGGVHPAIDAMCDDVIEERQIEIDPSRKIDTVKTDIPDPRLGSKAPRMVDMRRHRVDGVEGAARMGCRENVGGDPLAAA